MERIYIGMGSNLADPAEQLRSAVEALGQLPQTTLAGVSAFYQSDSLLPGQPRYTNAVAALDSALAPLELLDALASHRERSGPRTPGTLGTAHAGSGHPAVRRSTDRRATPQSPALPDSGTRVRALSPRRTGARRICAWPMAAPSPICWQPARSSAWNASPTPDTNPVGGLAAIGVSKSVRRSRAAHYRQLHIQIDCRTKNPRISPAAPLNRISNAGNTPLVTMR